MKTRNQVLPLCRKCANYFITHESAKPYGCRALGFKSRRNPAQVVVESSGLPCQLYSSKKKPVSGSDSRS